MAKFKLLFFLAVLLFCANIRAMEEENNNNPNLNDKEENSTKKSITTVKKSNVISLKTVLTTLILLSKLTLLNQEQGQIDDNNNHQATYYNNNEASYKKNNQAPYYNSNNEASSYQAPYYNNNNNNQKPARYNNYNNNNRNSQEGLSYKEREEQKQKQYQVDKTKLIAKLQRDYQSTANKQYLYEEWENEFCEGYYSKKTCTIKKPWSVYDINESLDENLWKRKLFGEDFCNFVRAAQCTSEVGSKRGHRPLDLPCKNYYFYGFDYMQEKMENQFCEGYNNQKKCFALFNDDVKERDLENPSYGYSESTCQQFCNKLNPAYGQRKICFYEGKIYRQIKNNFCSSNVCEPVYGTGRGDQSEKQCNYFCKKIQGSTERKERCSPISRQFADKIKQYCDKFSGSRSNRYCEPIYSDNDARSAYSFCEKLDKKMDHHGLICIPVSEELNNAMIKFCPAGFFGSDAKIRNCQVIYEEKEGSSIKPNTEEDALNICHQIKKLNGLNKCHAISREEYNKQQRDWYMAIFGSVFGGAGIVGFVAWIMKKNNRNE